MCNYNFFLKNFKKIEETQKTRRVSVLEGADILEEVAFWISKKDKRAHVKKKMMSI